MCSTWNNNGYSQKIPKIACSERSIATFTCLKNHRTSCELSLITRKPLYIFFINNDSRLEQNTGKKIRHALENVLGLTHKAIYNTARQENHKIVTASCVSCALNASEISMRDPGHVGTHTVML